MTSLNGAGCTIVVDAMGGDFAPDEVVKGAVDAARRGVSIVLVGRRETVDPLLEEMSAKLPVVHADDVIGMDEPVTSALRHRQASLQVAAQLVRDGEADAVLSCGNSAAIYFVAVYMWDRLPGIDRPAFSAIVPTQHGPIFLLDIGANPTVKVNNLVQFAIMGNVYMQLWAGMPAPRIGLLSNGTEDSKGTPTVKEANQILRKLDMNFVGNVEGNQIFENVVDVVVSDGFAGNVLLKGGEGVASEIFSLLKAELSKDVWSRVAAATLAPAFARIKRRLDYEEYGGAPVLGVNGVMINCHGRSKAKAVTNAILLAERMARERLVDRIGEALHRDDIEAAGRGTRLARALHLRAE